MVQENKQLHGAGSQPGASLGHDVPSAREQALRLRLCGWDSEHTAGEDGQVREVGALHSPPFQGVEINPGAFVFLSFLLDVIFFLLDVVFFLAVILSLLGIVVSFVVPTSSYICKRKAAWKASTSSRAVLTMREAVLYH